MPNLRPYTPFLDGNGRLGRMIIPILLYEKGTIKRPSFYISEELERNRDEYYARLRAVSEKNDWDGWCEFFLKAIANQAERNFEKARDILDLHEKVAPKLLILQVHSDAIRALDYFFTRPIFSSFQFRNDIDEIEYATVLAQF